MEALTSPIEPHAVLDCKYVYVYKCKYVYMSCRRISWADFRSNHWSFFFFCFLELIFFSQTWFLDNDWSSISNLFPNWLNYFDRYSSRLNTDFPRRVEFDLIAVCCHCFWHGLFHCPLVLFFALLFALVLALFSDAEKRIKYDVKKTLKYDANFTQKYDVGNMYFKQ